MATSTAYGTLLDRLIRELGIGLVIPNAKVDSFATGSITSADVLRDSNHGSGQYQGLDTVIYRGGSATAADNVRYAGALTPTSGLLAHTGANYADTTVGTKSVRLLYYRLRPDLEILDAANRALEFVNLDSFEALSHLSDLDGSMVAATDANWTDVGTVSTSAKSTTASRTPWGLRSYNLINDSVANSGTQSATIPAEEASQVSLWAIASCNVSTAALQFRDVTASAGFTSAPTVASDEEEPMFLNQPWIATPTDCKEMAARLIGTGATADIFWNGLWLYKRNVLRLNLPSHINEGFKITAILQARPRASQATANVYQAQGFDWCELREGQDYTWIMGQADANPHAILLRDSSYMDYPLFVQVRRPHSDLDSFTGDTSTTTAPVHIFFPRFKMEVLASCLMPRFPGEGKWAALYAGAQAEFEKAQRVRPKSDPAHQEWFSVGRRVR